MGPSSSSYCHVNSFVPTSPLRNYFTYNAPKTLETSFKGVLTLSFCKTNFWNRLENLCSL